MIITEFVVPYYEYPMFNIYVLYLRYKYDMYYT